MIAVPGADGQADHVAFAHGDAGKGAERLPSGLVRDPSGQRDAGGSATHLQVPRHPVAAHGVGPLHEALDPHAP